MNRYKCPIRDGDGPLYTLPLVILAKIKNHFCGRRAVLEGYVQLLGCQELDSDS